MINLKLEIFSLIGRALGIAFKVGGIPYGATPRPTDAAPAASRCTFVEFR